MCYWPDVYPRVFRKDNTQNPQKKYNVWEGILTNQILGPRFFEENLTGPLYLDELQNRIKPMIDKIVKENLNTFLINITFWQDGEPPHYYRLIREWLNDNYPKRWIA